MASRRVQRWVNRAKTALYRAQSLGARRSKQGPTREDVSAINRRAWNEAAPVHADLHFQRLKEGFEKPGFSIVKGIKRDFVMEHGLDGRSVFQLCCNNGRDLLSLKNMGAGRVVGFDLSDAFIEQGKALAAAGKIDCELYQADVYELGSEFDGQFDIGYITGGSLRPLPDVRGFFDVIARLLKPGGWLFMQEMHPIIDMFSMEPSDMPSRLKYSYFDGAPFRLTKGIDYYRVQSYDASPRYVFHHKLCDVMQACIDAGLGIETFREYDVDVSGGTFVGLERSRVRPPLSYTLTATKR